MKKRSLFMVSMVLSGTILFSSCIGSFNLSRKVLAWNKTIGDKFVNEVVFLALTIVPVYGICMFADAVVLNSIEFWTGENPVQAGLVKQVQGKDGNYTVETLEDGYNIKNDKGQEVNLIFDKETSTWNAVANDEYTKLFSFDGENSAIVYLPDGTTQRVELNSDGLLALRESVMGTTFFASK